MAAHEIKPRITAGVGPILEAVRGNVGQDQGVVSYAEIGAAPSSAGTEMRANSRRRTRLRSGKIVDLQNNFICDCLLHDRSSGGLRVRLVQDVALPARIRIYDDEAHGLVSADVVWRRGRDLGIRMHVVEPTGAADMDAPAATALGRKYYAVSNEVPARPIKSR